MGDLKLDINGIWIDETSNKVSYPDEANNANFEIEENSFWFKHRNEIIKQVIKRFPFKRNFADIGGGNGFQAKFISDNIKSKKIILLEPGYEGCLNSKKRGVENVYNIPFQKFNFYENNIGGIGLFDVIEHIEDDIKFMQQLKAKLPRNSYIYMTVPAYKSLWSDADDYGGHYRRYNYKMLKELATNSQVKLVFHSYFFSYIPFFTYFVKHLPYKIRGKRQNSTILKSETSQLSPSGLILNLFDIFHKIEIRTIKTGTIKIGGSCFAVFKT